MAQPAAPRTTLGIDAIWDKPTPDPPLCWEKWIVQYKLALLQKRTSFSIHYLDPKPEMMDLPLEKTYEENIIGSSAQSERERNARNAQLKMNWQNKCQRLTEVGIMCGDKPCPLADCKTVSLLYLSVGVKRCRILNCKNPHILIDTLSTAEFWKIVEETFIRPRNIIFDRHVFLITKQFRGETV